MKNKITIIGNSCDAQMIDELNAVAHGCVYEHKGTKEFSPTPEALIIVYELMLNLGYSATYDLLKASLIEIISKIRSKFSERKHTQLTVICGEDKSIIDLPFELTEAQKDKIVDAAIMKFLNGRAL